MKKAHAQHNKDLCIHLLSQGNYSDWVITTAFYSAIHFVDHCLFPLAYSDGNTYNTLDDLHAVFKKNYPSRHTLRQHVVDTYLNSQSTNYKYLKDSCWTARYYNYQVPQKRAGKCKSRLDAIEAACLTAKP